jgi:hypothetical protein
VWIHLHGNKNCVATMTLEEDDDDDEMTLKFSKLL